MYTNDLINLKNYVLLTTEEQHLVDEVLCGLTNKQIASKRNMSDKTLEPKLTEIYRKLELDSSRKEKRTELFSRVIALLRGKTVA
jgi:DNA-binding NarL/FixJ family response regulator